ncbi:MAG: DUF2523 family protein [Caldimonas sp.]|uniref:DUF2523 family protein n=1 Tax=Caldimonas sp. TaxID=2838790 RepID=UPI00391DDEEC
MQAIVTAIGYVLGKIVAALQWIGQLFIKVFQAASDLLSDIACWVFEQVLDIALGVVQVLDFSAITHYAASFGQLPAQVAEVLAACGLGSAMVIIGSAITTRLLLQLIPFTRLGS